MLCGETASTVVVRVDPGGGRLGRDGPSDEDDRDRGGGEGLDLAVDLVVRDDDRAVDRAAAQEGGGPGSPPGEVGEGHDELEVPLLQEH